ncbi:MAG TPA: hypothetical protein VFK33_05610 [Bacillales bacterium]|nr:hypothetical protein [Bacillales bacterium]
MSYYYDPYPPQSGWWQQQGQGGDGEGFTGEGVYPEMSRGQGGQGSQGQIESSQRQGSGSQGHGSTGTQGPGMGAQTPGGMYGPSMHYPQGAAGQGPGSAQGYSYLNLAALYPGASVETQYMLQVMANLENQLNRLTQLIAQNSQIIESMHNQEDTKCVQGNGGGAVIVRM